MAHPSGDKYKMFLNFMYNELGISNEDIKQWVRDAVMEVARDYINNQFETRSFDSRVKDLIETEAHLVTLSGILGRNHTISSFIEKEIARTVSEKVKIDIGMKEE
jgi:hypothetical protein